MIRLFLLAHFVNCFGFVFVGVFSLPHLLFSCDLMTHFSVVFWISFSFVCHRYLVFCYHEVLIWQSIYKQDCFKSLTFSFQMHFQYPALALSSHDCCFLYHICMWMVPYLRGCVCGWFLPERLCDKGLRYSRSIL